MTTTTCIPSSEQQAAIRQTNRARLRRAASAADVDLDSPVDTNASFRLLREIGFRADRPRLDYHLKSGKLSPPAKILGHFAWCEESILDFADSLEQTKDWLPFSSLDTWLRDH